MNIRIFLGSPRKNGNTHLLAEAVIQGIRLENPRARIETIHLPQLDIHPCIGCGTCEREGHCIFEDDMQALYEKITKAHRIVIASPIYFYAVTAQTKVFIDRCQALWSRKYILRQRHPEHELRRGYLISVAATRGERLFEGAILTSRYVLDAMDCPYAGELTIAGADSRGVVGNRPEVIDRARQFGRTIAAP